MALSAAKTHCHWVHCLNQHTLVWKPLPHLSQILLCIAQPWCRHGCHCPALENPYTAVSSLIRSSPGCFAHCGKHALWWVSLLGLDRAASAVCLQHKCLI